MTPFGPPSASAWFVVVVDGDRQAVLAVRGLGVKDEVLYVDVADTLDRVGNPSEQRCDVSLAGSLGIRLGEVQDRPLLPRRVVAHGGSLPPRADLPIADGSPPRSGGARHTERLIASCVVTLHPLPNDDPLATLRLAARRLALGRQPPEDLPDIATEALVDGVDSPALRELAGTLRVDYQDARDVFYRVCDELDIEIPDPTAARWHFVCAAASAIVNGDVAPLMGASQIWDEWHGLDMPKALAPFVYLVSAWEDDPAHREEYERDMIAEATALLADRT